MNFEQLIYERRGAAAWVTLNRPDVLNSLNPGIIDELNEAMNEAQADDNVRALVITGTGRAFDEKLPKILAKLVYDPANAATKRNLSFGKRGVLDRPRENVKTTCNNWHLSFSSLQFDEPV